MSIQDESRATSPAAQPQETDANAPLDTVGLTVSPRRRFIQKLTHSTPFLLLVLLFALALFFSYLRPDAFPTPVNARNILTDVSVLLVMAVSMTFVMVAGGFDLSIGSILVFASVMAARTMEANGGDGWVAVFLGLFVGLASGTAWGLFNGFIITKLHVPALIATLGTMGAALGIAKADHVGQRRSHGPGGPRSAVLEHVPGVAVHSPAVRECRAGWWSGPGADPIRAAHVHHRVQRRGSATGRKIRVDRHLIVLYGMNGLLAGLAGSCP